MQDVASFVHLIPLILILSTILLVLFYFRSKFPHLPGPSFREYLPGGEMHSLFYDTSLMHRILIRLSKKYGAVYQLWLGPLDVVVTSVPAHVTQIISSTQTFERPQALRIMFEAVVPDSLLCVPREAHLNMRRHFKDAFNSANLEAFHPEISDAVDELNHSFASIAQSTDDDKQSPIFDIAELFAIAVFRVITNVAFGFKLDSAQRLFLAKSTDKLVDNMMLDMLGYPLRHRLEKFGSRHRLFSSRDQVVEFCEPLVNARLGESVESRKSRSPDLLDAIIQLEGNNVRSIVNQVIVFAVAGSHTTTETLGWSIYETCSNPNVEKAVHDELNTVLEDKPLGEPLSMEDVNRLVYLKQVWMETLRKHPPGPIFARLTTKDVQFSGRELFLPKGTTVIALPHGAHMNPAVWPKPDSFIPERWETNGSGWKVPLGAYVPFSVGSRNCPGRFLADHEGILILAEIHRRFVFTLACNPEGLVSCTGWSEFSRMCGKNVNRPAGLPVRVRMRNLRPRKRNDM